MDDTNSILCLIGGAICVSICCSPCIAGARGANKHPKVAATVAITVVAVAIIAGTVGILAATGQLGSVVQYALNAWSIPTVKIGLLAGSGVLLLGGIVGLGCRSATKRRAHAVSGEAVGGEERHDAPILHDVPPARPHYVPPARREIPRSPVDPSSRLEDAIRDHFYGHQLQEAAKIAVKKGMLYQDDIDTFESFVCSGLPALACFLFLKECHEKGQTGTSFIVDGKRITEENCPDDFKEFFHTLKQMQEKLVPFWRNEDANNLLVLMLFGNEIKQNEQDALQNKFPAETVRNLGSIAGIATGMAYKITRRPAFQECRFASALAAIRLFVPPSSPSDS